MFKSRKQKKLFEFVIKKYLFEYVYLFIRFVFIFYFSNEETKKNLELFYSYFLWHPSWQKSMPSIMASFVAKEINKSTTNPRSID